MTKLTDFGRFQTCSHVMKSVIHAAEKASLLQASIFISGERGSGRRSLARWIHDRGPQRSARFVAWSHDEKIQIQEGDTVLIENIHEFDPVQLLRIRKTLEENTSTRVRWIVTSEMDAKNWMNTSKLARDLGYRFCVLSLEMPTLSDRREDISGLAQLFLNVACLMNGLPVKTLSAQALEVLENHRWAGHVAELNNAVEKAALSCEGSQIGPHELSFLLEEASGTRAMDIAQAGMSLFEMEKKLILQTLELTRQNKTRAAQILGISIRTLRNKLNTYRGVETVMEAGVL